MTVKNHYSPALTVVPEMAMSDEDWRSLLKHLLRCPILYAEAKGRLRAELLTSCVEWVQIAFSALLDLQDRSDISPKDEGFGEAYRDSVRLLAAALIGPDEAAEAAVCEILGAGGIVDAAFDIDRAEFTESRGRLLLKRCLSDLAVVKPLEAALSTCRRNEVAPANLSAILDEAAARCRSVDAIDDPPIRTLGDEWSDHWKRLHQLKGRPLIGLKTGMPELDRRTLGLRGLIILGAKPGSGKTTYACVQVAVGVCRHHALNDAVVVVVSLDMDRFEVYNSIHCHLADIDWRSLALGSPKETRAPGKWYSTAHKACIDRAKRRLDGEQVGKRLCVLDREHFGDDVTAARLSAAVEMLKAKVGAKRALVVIDYLQLMPVPESAGVAGDLAADRYRVRVVQKFIERSRSEANPLGDTVIAISELRKPPTAKDMWGDSMSELMGSARNGYAADAVILYREMTTPEVKEYYQLRDKAAADRHRDALREDGIVPVMLILDKGRAGMSRGKWPVEFHYRKSTFHEIDLSNRRHAVIPDVDANHLNGDGESPAGKSVSTKRDPLPLPPPAPGTRATKKRKAVNPTHKSGKATRSGKRPASTNKQRSPKP